MRLIQTIFTALLLLSLGIVSRAAGDERRGEVGEFTYLEVTTGEAAIDDVLPMIVGLHYMSGSSETSVTDYGGLDFPARLIFPAGLHPSKDGYSWFPLGYYESDESRQGDTTRAVAEQLAEFISEVLALRPTVGKPIVTGYSQGGDLSYVLALYHPGLIRAALPMGARLPEAWRPNLLPTLAEHLPPVYVFHGLDDGVVPVARAREAAAYIESLGSFVELHEYPETGHDYPESMSSDYRRIVSDLLTR